VLITPGESFTGTVGDAAKDLPPVLHPSLEGAELNVGEAREMVCVLERRAEDLVHGPETAGIQTAAGLVCSAFEDGPPRQQTPPPVPPAKLDETQGSLGPLDPCLVPDVGDGSLGRALAGLVSPHCQCEVSVQGTLDPSTTIRESSTLKVYSRRQRDPLRQTPSPHESISVESGQVKDTTPGCDFVAMVTKKTDGLLPPLTPLKRSKQLPPDFVPRYSNRLAKRRTPNDASRQIQIDLIRMDIVNAKEVISDEALEKYGRLFNSPLSESHIKAFSALFGWSVPVDIHLLDVQVMSAGLGPEDLE
jgi:hypothetical protein